MHSESCRKRQPANQDKQEGEGGGFRKDGKAKIMNSAGAAWSTKRARAKPGSKRATEAGVRLPEPSSETGSAPLTSANVGIILTTSVLNGKGNFGGENRYLPICR